jgi:hypothetical protein
MNVNKKVAGLKLGIWTLIYHVTEIKSGYEDNEEQLQNNMTL